MLQQTQVTTVIPKFNNFISQFPNFETLAESSIIELLQAWSGLGYNNRAIRLRRAAQLILTYPAHHQFSISELNHLPGIGHATASAIYTYCYNLPCAYIETNIRRVFLHHCFPKVSKVSDTEILPYVEAAIDHDNPREWYWALMDYGSYLKTQLPNPNLRSKHYTLQSKLSGSVRELRGEILRRLTNSTSVEDLLNDPRYERAVQGLTTDGWITVTNNRPHLL